MIRAQQASTVVSASSEGSVGSDDDSHDDPPNHHRSTKESADHFYGSEIDDEDEAWVYRNLRGGVEENVTIISQGVNGESTRKTIKVLKPRTSDAVLSCPCCLQTVCMDCQKHERYENQFRAMFVMNIGVDWEKTLIYSEEAKSLVEHGMDGTISPRSSSDDVYYSVHCCNCKTTVAALDMRDEVYHFFGCIASS